MIGDVEKTTAWGSGVEHMSLGFVRYTLQERLTEIEQQQRTRMDASVNRKPHSLLMLLFRAQMPFSAQTILSWEPRLGEATTDTHKSEFS